MSSFFDRTQQILQYGLESGMDPEAIVRIAEQRFLQCKEHMTRASRLLGGKRLLGQLNWPGVPRMIYWNYLMKKGSVYLAYFERMLSMIQNSEDVPDFYFSADGLEIIQRIFEDLHSYGHELAKDTNGKISDNPYPRGRRGFPDSDVWLIENFPEMCKDLGIR